MYSGTMPIFRIWYIAERTYLLTSQKDTHKRVSFFNTEYSNQSESCYYKPIINQMSI